MLLPMLLVGSTLYILLRMNSGPSPRVIRVLEGEIYEVQACIKPHPNTLQTKNFVDAMARSGRTIKRQGTTAGGFCYVYDEQAQRSEVVTLPVRGATIDTPQGDHYDVTVFDMKRVG